MATSATPAPTLPPVQDELRAVVWLGVVVGEDSLALGVAPAPVSRAGPARAG